MAATAALRRHRHRRRAGRAGHRNGAAGPAARVAAGRSGKGSCRWHPPERAQLRRHPRRPVLPAGQPEGAVLHRRAAGHDGVCRAAPDPVPADRQAGGGDPGQRTVPAGQPGRARPGQRAGRPGDRRGRDRRDRAGRPRHPGAAHPGERRDRLPAGRGGLRGHGPPGRRPGAVWVRRAWPGPHGRRLAGRHGRRAAAGRPGDRLRRAAGRPDRRADRPGQRRVPDRPVPRRLLHVPPGRGRPGPRAGLPGARPGLPVPRRALHPGHRRHAARRAERGARAGPGGVRPAVGERPGPAGQPALPRAAQAGPGLRTDRRAGDLPGPGQAGLPGRDAPVHPAAHGAATSRSGRPGSGRSA